MKHSLGTSQLFGFGVTSFLGTLLHFLYEWSDEAIWIAPFSGVNESTWEHMKLLFWPLLAYTVVQSFFFGSRKDFFCIKLRGSLLGLILIPTLFYTYNGVIGRSPDFINIAIFFISAAATYIYETKLFRRGNVFCKSNRAAFFSLLFIALLFVIFTFKTPKIGIFKDPLTGGYGIN